MEYIESEYFDPAGLGITAYYTNGGSSSFYYNVAPQRFTILVPDNPLSYATPPQDQNVTVKYTENGITRSAQLHITVQKNVVTSIYFYNYPKKVFYHEGDAVDTTGVVVRGLKLIGYDDNLNDECNFYIAEIDGTWKFVAQHPETFYDGSTEYTYAYYNITYTTGELESIEFGEYTQTEFVDGKKTFGDVIAHYTDGVSCNTGYMYIGTELAELSPSVAHMGDTELTASFTDNGITKTDTVSITVVPVTVNSISITRYPYPMERGSTLNINDVSVRAYYTDGVTERDVTSQCTFDPPMGTTVNESFDLNASYTEDGKTVTDYTWIYVR